MIVTEESVKPIILSDGEFVNLEIINGVLKLKLQTVTSGIEYYFTSGTAIFKVDMGRYFIDYKNIQRVTSIPANAILNIYTATSSDNITFSDYILISQDGIINSDPKRYMRIKIEMTGSAVDTQVIRNDFVESESNQFEANNYVIFDGAMHLRRVFYKPLIRNTVYTEDGYVYYVNMSKSNYRKFENVEIE